MVILVKYGHFHGIKSLFCPMEHKFPAVTKNVLKILPSKPVPLYGYERLQSVFVSMRKALAPG